MNRKEKIKGLFKMFYLLFKIVKRDIPILDFYYIAKNKTKLKTDKISSITLRLSALLMGFILTLIFFKFMPILAGLGWIATGLTIFPLNKAMVELIDSSSPISMPNLKLLMYENTFISLSYYFIGFGLALIILF